MPLMFRGSKSEPPPSPCENNTKVSKCDGNNTTCLSCRGGGGGALMWGKAGDGPKGCKVTRRSL